MAGIIVCTSPYHMPGRLFLRSVIAYIILEEIVSVALESIEPCDLRQSQSNTFLAKTNLKLNLDVRSFFLGGLTMVNLDNFFMGVLFTDLKAFTVILK